jgi:acetolactate synthase I/II/III large subunit
MNGAEALLRTLVAGGVDICFANPGTSEMHIMDATARVPELRLVPCLFEGVATGAADGYARMTGRPAATLLHLAPGLANGLANLHNAGKARTPLLNIVGEHPAYHRVRETPLGSDIEGAARPFSGWLRTSASTAQLAADAVDAIQAAMTGKVATLAVPADIAWGDGAQPAAPRPGAQPTAPASATIEQSLAMLVFGVSTALILGDKGLYGAGLAFAGRIADATGAALIAPFPLARLERGRGRPTVTRLPYVSEQARALLGRFHQFIFVGAVEPFAYFAHQDDDAVLLPPGSTRCVLTDPGEDTVAALAQLADAFPWGEAQTSTATTATLPSGALSPDGIAGVIAGLLPEQAIVVDEGMTCGRAIMAACRDSSPHDWLGNTGGSIGIAMPLAIGAALARPDRPILCLSADGSGMYTLQSLWTMAREALAITTVIFANSAYALLKHEYARVAAGQPAQTVMDRFDLTKPTLDWVSLAAGMGVPAQRVGSLEALASALRTGFESGGPNLIEVPL